MTRAALPFIALMAVVTAVLIAGTAFSISDSAVPTVADVAEVKPTRTATRTPTGPAALPSTVTPTPTRTVTPLPDCQVTLFQGSVCSWPTSTQEVPLPRCATPDPGKACVREGAAVVTMIGATP